MFLAVVYLVGGVLLVGFVLWTLTAGGSSLSDYLSEQQGWKVVFGLLFMGGGGIFLGLRTLLGEEGQMSRLAALRRERDLARPRDQLRRTRESDVLRGPQPKG